MNIYFFSYHAHDPKMIEDLGAPLTAQFKGDISDIHAKGNCICFTETLYLGGQRIKVNHTIPNQSIVIVEAPTNTQQEWLTAGVSTLLIPQIKPEVGVRGGVVPKYCGLLQVHEIEVVTSVWSNGTNAEADSERLATEEKANTNSSSSFSIFNLLQALRWKPVKPAVFS